MDAEGTIFVPDASIRDLVNRWIDDADKVGINVTQAEKKLEDACALDPKDPTQAGEAFGLLCEAYDELVPFSPPRSTRVRGM